MYANSFASVKEWRHVRVVYNRGRGKTKMYYVLMTVNVYMDASVREIAMSELDMKVRAGTVSAVCW